MNYLLGTAIFALSVAVSAPVAQEKPSKMASNRHTTRAVQAYEHSFADGAI